MSEYDSKFWRGFKFGGVVFGFGVALLILIISAATASPGIGTTPISLTQPSAWCHAVGESFVQPEPYDDHYGFWAIKWVCAPGWEQHPLNN